MRCRRLLVWTVLVAGLGFGPAGSAFPGDAVRYSGTVVGLDPAQGVLVIDEVGPWRVRQGHTVVTRRTIGLQPTTRFNVFIRVDVPGRFAGDFIEVALEPTDVTAGDFVTAECVRDRGRLVARTVTLADTVHP